MIPQDPFARKAQDDQAPPLRPTSPAPYAGSPAPPAQQMGDVLPPPAPMSPAQPAGGGMAMPQPTQIDTMTRPNFAGSPASQAPAPPDPISTAPWQPQRAMPQFDQTPASAQPGVAPQMPANPAPRPMGWQPTRGRPRYSGVQGPSTI